MVPKETIERYVDSVDTILTIDIPEQYRPGVVSNLERLLRMAQLFTDIPLVEEPQIAPAFEP